MGKLFWLLLFHLLNQQFDLVQLFGRSLMVAQRLHDQLGGGAPKQGVHKPLQQTLLRAGLLHGGLVNVNLTRRAFNRSFTWRTVEGPCCQRTCRISSSDSVGGGVGSGSIWRSGYARVLLMA